MFLLTGYGESGSHVRAGGAAVDNGSTGRDVSKSLSIVAGRNDVCWRGAIPPGRRLGKVKLWMLMCCCQGKMGIR